MILDKGLVIDVFVRVSFVGIEILTMDARIVMASVDTYLRFAEPVNRLDLMATETQGVPGVLDEIRGMAREASPKGYCRAPRQPSSARGMRTMRKVKSASLFLPAAAVRGARASLRRRKS